MTPEITLLHRIGSTRFDLSKMGPHAFSFQTCLRHIVLIDEHDPECQWLEEVRDEDERLVGEDAYKLLLEIICGLHSPLLGETEVNGQFRNTVAQFSIPATPWGSQLSKAFRALFEDAKRIRQAHLVDLGSQSYGSILRRELKTLTKIHILGAGHLVEECLPWIAKDGLEIVVHCRNPEKVQAAFANHKNVSVRSMDEKFDHASAQALVIAAPVSSQDLAAWWTGRALGFVADLRADSASDSHGLDSARTLNLGEFLTRLTANQAVLSERKALALNAIERASSERSKHVENRPFGWEDVCA